MMNVLNDNAVRPCQTLSTGNSLVGAGEVITFRRASQTKRDKSDKCQNRQKSIELQLQRFLTSMPSLVFTSIVDREDV